MKTIYKILKKASKIFVIFLFVTVVATTFIVQTSGDNDYQFNPENKLVVNDVTKLNPIKVATVIEPKTNHEITNAIKNSTGPISIGGGRYSMGGQTAYENSLHFDMRGFNKILEFNKAEKVITVQTGITWRDLQEYIDPHNLSVRIMQTYANFTVGGSLSVNVHGRYMGEGPLIRSIQSIKIILANGEEKTADRNMNSELFYSAIGGYGGVGVITEATLSLTDNIKIERKTIRLSTEEYLKNFKKNVRNNPEIVFHNGDIYPPNYDQVLDVGWYKTDKALTIDDRLIKKNDDYKWLPRALNFVADYDFGKSIRRNIIDPMFYNKERVVWRNWEASYDVAELGKINTKDKSYILREYFVPVDSFHAFIPKMKKIFNENDVNIINVSIRHAFAEPDNYLSWAREEVFAFVVYYRQGTDQEAMKKVHKWSIEMIDAVIQSGGTYYLPYQIFATPEQFKKGYPNSLKFFEVKKKVDPENRFRNQLWAHHYPSEDQEIRQEKSKIKNYYKDQNQSVLSVPEWYLVFNPLEYAEFLEREENPSDFPFMASLDEYWTLYDRVVAINKQQGQENSEYMTMLKVIGISTTVEFMYKSLYENTIGRFTRWTAGGETTEEDRIIAKAHRAYSDLIFDEAWYKFDFSGWIKRIWVEPDFFSSNFIRKTERKLSFTLEFGFKTLYAKLIGFGAQTAYEPSDGLVYLTATFPQTVKTNLPTDVEILYENNDIYILAVPRWGDFTKIVPVLSELGVEITDIAGNQEIVISSVRGSDDKTKYSYATPLFKSTLVSNDESQRDVVQTDVSLIDEFLTELKDNGHRLEHIYDF